MINFRDYQYKVRTGQIKPPANICFAFPRSGSTLLMRLLSVACNMKVKGDFDLSFYENLMKLRKDYKHNAIYGDFFDLEKKYCFPDTYRGREEKQEGNMFDYHMRNIALACTSNGFTKTTILGFGNRSLEEYVSMMREIYADSWTSTPLQIVWLTRDKKDCAESLWNRYSELMTDEQKVLHEQSFKKINIKLLEQQHEQFQECYEIGDLCVSYDDLVNNTMETLLKFKPSYYPDEVFVKKVIGRVIR